MKNIQIGTDSTDISLEKVKALIEDALYHFYKNDGTLIDYKTENKAVSERCMVFRIGLYIQNYMSQKEEWSLLNLDAEYNRCFDHPKGMYKLTLDGIREKIKDAVPDLLIHKRKKNESNIAVFEFKKGGPYAKNGRDADFEKLKYFTNPENEYKYRYGFWIVLYRERKADVYIFINGKEKSDKKYTWKMEET